MVVVRQISSSSVLLRVVCLIHSYNTRDKSGLHRDRASILLSLGLYLLSASVSSVTAILYYILVTALLLLCFTINKRLLVAWQCLRAYNMMRSLWWPSWVAKMQHYLVRDKHLQRCARIIRTDATNLPPIYVHHCHHSSHVFHLTLDKSSAFVFWYLLSRLLASLGHLSCAPEFFWFLLRDAMHSADCVCLSVRYYIKIAKCRQTFLSIG